MAQCRWDLGWGGRCRRCLCHIWQSWWGRLLLPPPQLPFSPYPLVAALKTCPQKLEERVALQLQYKFYLIFNYRDSEVNILLKPIKLWFPNSWENLKSVKIGAILLACISHVLWMKPNFPRPLDEEVSDLHWLQWYSNLLIIKSQVTGWFQEEVAPVRFGSACVKGH